MVRHGEGATAASRSLGGEPPVEGGRGGVVARSKAASRASIALVGGDRGNQPPAGASLMIVVRLVSATRRPTVHRAHHDRDGGPATMGARRTSGRRPVTPRTSGGDRLAVGGAVHTLGGVGAQAERRPSLDAVAAGATGDVERDRGPRPPGRWCGPGTCADPTRRCSSS